MPESSPVQDHSLNILRFRRPTITDEHVRIATYVLLGMTLGVIVVALFIDFSKPSKELPAKEEVVTPKESKDESNTQGAE